MGKRVQKEKVLKDVLLFFLKVNLFLIPFYAILYFDVKYEPLQILFASVVRFFVSIFGFQVQQEGFMLYLGETKFPIDISFDCIGWKSAYSLLALILASPGKLNEKLLFSLKWIPLMFLFNLLRVIFALVVGFVFGFNFMLMLHDYILQPMMIALVLFVWLIYLRKGRRFIEGKR